MYKKLKPFMYLKINMLKLWNGKSRGMIKLYNNKYSSFYDFFFPIRQTENHVMGKEIWITIYLKINSPLTKQYWSKNFRSFS